MALQKYGKLIRNNAHNEMIKSNLILKKLLKLYINTTLIGSVSLETLLNVSKQYTNLLSRPKLVYIAYFLLLFSPQNPEILPH